MSDIKLSSQRTEEAEEQIGEVENGVQTTWFTFNGPNAAHADQRGRSKRDFLLFSIRIYNML